MVGLNILFFLAPLTALIGLFVSYLFHKNMKKEDSGTKKMQKIAKHVREGAKAYLLQQYKVVAIFFIFALLSFISDSLIPFFTLGSNKFEKSNLIPFKVIPPQKLYF